jgi:hypothetical protein
MQRRVMTIAPSLPDCRYSSLLDDGNDDDDDGDSSAYAVLCKAFVQHIPRWPYSVTAISPWPRQCES